MTTRAAALSDVGRVRQDNQDRYLIHSRDGTTLLAVADGVGGEAGGNVASAAAVDALATRFFAQDRGDVPAALAAAMRDVNDAVVRASRESGHPMAASTLVAAAVRGESLAVGNLGDSRAYLIRAGAARQITADHAGEGPNVITRFVGDPRGAQPDVFVERLHRGDRVVLCSDGLTRYVGDEEIAGRVAARPPERAARDLVDLANERGGEDNVTVIVYPARVGAGIRRSVAFVLLFTLVALVLAGALAVLISSGAFAPPLAPPPSPAPSPTAVPSPTPAPTF